MSNFIAPAVHPRTGVIEDAVFIDGHFGRHRYGVSFSDGTVWRPEQVKLPKNDDRFMGPSRPVDRGET